MTLSIKKKTLRKVVSSLTMLATVVSMSGLMALSSVSVASAAVVDGSLIKSNATNSDGSPTLASLDVYIVKLVGTKMFKRLMLNPTVFESYGHLNWGDIQTVSQAVMDTYTTSSLVRVDTDLAEKVYAMAPDGDIGSKSWVNLTSAQFLGVTGSDADAIYTINAVDGGNYTAVGDVTTTTELTAFYTAGTLPGVVPVPAQALAVALSASTPASSTVVVDASADNAQAYIPFLKLNFTAGSDGAAMVKTINLKRSGIPSLDTDISNVQLYDGSTKIADYSSFSSGVIGFNKSSGLFTVPAGTTKEITVTADIADAATGSRNIKFSVETSSDIVTDGATVTGSFPIAGNLMNVADIGTNLLATAVLATVSNGSGTEPGTTAQELWKFRITGANKKVDVKKIKFTMVGTIDADDLQNIALYQGSTQLGTTAAQLESDKTVTFDFTSSPFEINKTAKDFSLKGDIIGGTARTYKFSVQSMDDVEVWDKENGVRIKAGAADSWTVIEAAAATSISTGNLTVSKTMNVATGNIAADGLDQVLASFDFKATGEPIKVTSIYVEADTSVAGAGIDNAKIYVDGSQLGSTSDLAEDTTATFAIGNSLVIQPGETKQIEVRGDVKKAAGTSFTASDTIAIYLSSASGGGADGNSTAYTKTISMGTANTGGVSGYSRTVQTGALTTAKNASVINWSTANPVGVVGATNVLVGSFIATVGSGEAVYIDDVQITDTTTTAFSELQNVKVKVNGTEVGTTIATPVTTTIYTYSLNPRIEAVASSQVTINVYADIKSSGTLASPDAITLAQVSATGKSTSADAKDATDRLGQTLVSSTGGSLTVSLSGNTPASAILVMGTTGATEVAKYVVEETTGAEDMVITKLLVINTLTTDTNLINYSLWDGAAQAGSTQASSASGVVTFSGLSVSVPKGTAKTLTVKAQANSYPNATAGAENIIRIASGTTYVTAEGASSGPQTTTVASNLNGNIFEVYRTNLTTTKGTVTGDGLTGRGRGATQAVAQVKLVADLAYNAKIRAASTADAITDSLTPTSPAGTWAVVNAGTADSTVTVNTTTPVIGTNVLRFTKGTADGIDSMRLTYTANQDWSSYSKIGYWLRSSQTADAITLVMTDNGGATTLATTTIVAANTWQFVSASLPSTATSKDVVSLLTVTPATELTAADTVDIDNIQLYNDSVVLDIDGNLLAAIPDGVAFTLKDASSTTKMTGYYTGTATAGTVTLLADSEISAGNTEQVFTVYTNTSSLMLIDTVNVETLNVGIDLGNASTAGDIRWYDGAVTATSPITWVSGSTPISFSFGY